MKHTIIIFVLSACAFIASAKTSTTKNETSHDSVIRMHKPLANISYELNDDEMTFRQLPYHAVAMLIFDELGNIASSGTLTRKNNTVNVKQLQPGTYTIVLKQGSKVKMLGYHTEVVVKSRRINC